MSNNRDDSDLQGQYKLLESEQELSDTQEQRIANNKNMQNSASSNYNSIQNYQQVIATDSQEYLQLITSQKSLAEYDTKEIYDVTIEVLYSSLAVSTGMLLQFTIISINLHFAGKITDPLYVDAVGLTFLMINCTGGFLIIGYNQALGAYVGRAFGSKSRSKSHTFFTQSIIIYFCLFLLICFLIWNSETILLFVGQHSDVAKETEIYASSILFGLFCNYLADLIRNFLNGQHHYIYPMIVLLLSAIFHYFLTLYLFELYGFTGTIYSINITFAISATSMYLLSVVLGCSPKIMFDKIQHNFLSYFQEATYIAIPVQLDFIAFEVNGIFIGTLGHLKQFGAHLGLANFVSLFYSFPTGLGGALMYLTSNALGARDVIKAKNYAQLGIIISFLEGIAFFFIMRFFQWEIASFYFQDPEMQRIFTELLEIYTLCVIIDNMQTALSGIVRGSGKATSALKAFVVCYFCIGIPLSCFLGFYLEMGAYGFWYGFNIAIYSVFVLLGVILYKTNFEQQVEIVQYQIISTAFD